MKRYDPGKLEPAVRELWIKANIDVTKDDSDKPKRFVLEFMPYPSGAAMHVGHVRNYTMGDVLARYYRMQGFNVLHPMAWDAFGLPAENYAIEHNVSPQIAVAENTAKFKQQLTQMGFSYDWSRELNSSDPSYYKWTQWFFKLLLERGLAYQKESPQWWCETDQTVLANEQVENGKCWRCGNLVVKKSLKQWFFKITDYADRLVADLDDLDWSDAIKSMQRNWIGRSVGAEIEFRIQNLESSNSKPQTPNSITVFTTRPDTLFGVTFMVLAPEHPLVSQITTKEQQAEVEKYIKESQAKSDIERMETERPKTGVFTGAYAINPTNNEPIPIWVADYVLMGYGTGAIMAVPAHDERDNEFAKKFDLPIKEVILPHRIDNNNPPQEGKEQVFRRAVHGIVYDPKTDRYLCVQWKKQPWTAFVVGGVEEQDNGDVIAAALREIREETGYKNVKPIRILGGNIVSEFYAAHKGINRKALFSAVLFELIDNERDEISAEEQEVQEAIWLKRSEITPQRMTCSELDLFWDRIDDPNNIYTGEGILTASGNYDDLESSEAREKIVADLAKKGVAKEQVNYKIRDWLISRQRYWGAPIPIIHCPKCGAVPVPNKDLPVVLPDVESYKPTSGQPSVLAGVEQWVNVPCPVCGEPAKRETDTMDGFACSSWYYLRFADPHNASVPFDRDLVERWLPVDDYIGGAEHAVMHLLYARFWTKVMFDAGLINFDEPFTALRNHGMILAPDGRKMSKSWKNTIAPDDLIEQGYGADSIRIMELFIGPWNQEAAWSTEGLGGCYRFLQRVWTITQKYLEYSGPTNEQANGEILKAAHRTIKKVTVDMTQMGFNTTVASLMEYANELYKIEAKNGFGNKTAWDFALKSLVLLIAPLAPHISEELWQQFGQPFSVHQQTWPQFDEAYLVEHVVNIAIQVNGKIRGQIEMPFDSEQSAVEEAAKQHEKAASYITGNIKKAIYIPNKLISFVV